MMNKKETNTLKGIRIGICFLLVAGMAACNGETEVVEDDFYDDDVAVATADTWDRDAYYSDFTATTYFEDWDKNDDNLLDEEEFTAGFYETFDQNKDGRISQEEWITVVSDFGIDRAADWEAWDTDGDGFIDRATFDADFAEMGWYGAWDADADSRITEREYTDGVFVIWDKNNDNVLDETEIMSYGRYYGD